MIMSTPVRPPHPAGAEPGTHRTVRVIGSLSPATRMPVARPGSGRTNRPGVDVLMSRGARRAAKRACAVVAGMLLVGLVASRVATAQVRTGAPAPRVAQAVADV